MRRALIRWFLPSCFSLVPLFGCVLVGAAVPVKARDFYLEHLSAMDWLILGVGFVLFALQLLLSWRALHWRGSAFDERPDRWLTNLAQAAEWFPMLGLIGTVAGILQTFGELGKQSGQTDAHQIIALYAPAITATGSGLVMALVNILPTWVVILGRQLILALGGTEPSTWGETQP